MPTTDKKIENIRSDRRLSATPFENPLFSEDDKNHFAVTVAVPAETAYAFFRDFQNLPIFMKGLKSVKMISQTRSHWTVEVKGRTVEWEAEITAQRPGQMISWKSIPGSEVTTSGSIWFSPAPEALGTVISLSLDYSVPGGKLTELLTMLAGEDPKSLAITNIKRLKCYLETGEIATIDGQSSGREDETETILKH